MTRHSGTTIETSIRRRMARKGLDRVWNAGDFYDLGTPVAVRQALGRMVVAGDLHRAVPGVFCLLADNRLTGGKRMPNTLRFVEAIARRGNFAVLVDGASAANGLGWEDLVPARATVYANTLWRHVDIASPDPDAKPYRIDFVRVGNRKSFWAGRPGMYAVQALDYLKDKVPGNEAVHAARLARLFEERPEVREDLRANAMMAPPWMRDIVRSALSSPSKEDVAADEAPRGPMP